MDIKKLEQRSKSVKAKDLMSRFAITIKENENVTNLAHLLMRFKISGVPVIDQNGYICGIVTATDLFNLMKKIVTDIDQGKNSVDYLGMKISEIMVKNVVTITEETTLYDMMNLMSSKNIHTLPVMVVDQHEIIGVIGRRDIINAFYVGSGDQARTPGKG